MKGYITLPILFNNAATTSMENCDIDYKLTDCDVRDVHFFNLDVVMPYWEDNVEYSKIIAGGRSFYSTLADGYVLDMVDEQNTGEFTIYDN